MIETPRPITLETPLPAGASVQVAAPRSRYGRRSAERIRDALQERGVTVTLAADPGDDILLGAPGPVIMVGNLADSQCVRALYFRFLCATDRWYPGPRGYELRTLCNPLGTGYNVILVGYSDEAGAKLAAEALLPRLADPLPPLFELKITRLPLSDDQISQCYSCVFEEPERKAANFFGHKRGYLHYLTGDPWLGQEYRETWRATVGFGHDKPGMHLGANLRWTPWRLVEDLGLFPDGERLAVIRWMADWAEGKEGWRHVMACPRCKDEHIPRQNHELTPAQALAYLGDYFGMYHPDVEEAATWREVAAHVFKPYGPHWKPICDGLCNGWWASQTAMMDNALSQPGHGYFELGGARKIADYAVACINNDGWFPSAGDSGISRQFPDPVLRMAAAYYSDGRYEWQRRRVDANRRLGWHVIATRAFDAGLDPVRPDEFLGVTVLPMDPLVYDVWEKNPQIAHEAATTPPNVPIEQCFDKIAVRAGWELEDDYLLIDGLGGGSHSYDDAGSVLDYQRLGISVIVANDGINMSAPEEHSLVTIVRDGESGAIPAFPALEANETHADGNVYLRIRSKDYAGTDWVREIHFLPGRCVVFVDTVEAKKTGEYAVEAHFRTPARFELNGAEARCRRQTPGVGEVTFRIASSCDASELSVLDKPVEAHSRTDEQKKFWRMRYRTDEIVLTSLRARKVVRMNPGDAVTMVHVAQVVAPGESDIVMRADAGGVALTEGDATRILATTAKIKPVDSIGVTGIPGRLDATGIFDAEDSLTALHVLRDGKLFAGAASGSVYLLDPGGAGIWRSRLEGPVHDLSAAEGDETLLAVGHGPSKVSAFSTAGDPLWATDVAYQPCPWPWFQMPTAAAVQVKGCATGGTSFFVVGAGDMHFRRLDRHGNEVWVERFDESVPGRLRIADVDGSGRAVIAVGGDILADQATVRLFDLDGKLLHELEVEDWVSRSTALAFATAGDRRFIACGANRGRNIHLYELDRQAGCWRRLWLARLGGEVTGIELQADRDRVIVVTSQAFLMGYDLAGNTRWTRLQRHPALAVARLSDDILVSDEGGTLSRVTLDGEVAASCPLPNPSTILRVGTESVYLVSANRILNVLP